MSVIAQPIYAGCPVTTFPPLITSISPQGVIQGATGRTVTITGNYLSGASVDISGAGVTWSVSSSSDTFINLSVTVDLAAIMVQRTVTVSNAYGSTSTTLNILDATYPGGRFMCNRVVYSGGRFGTAHFGVDRFRAVDYYTWQLSKLLVDLDGTWWTKRLYRWDVAQNTWLRVETQAPTQLVWGQTKWGYSTW